MTAPTDEQVKKAFDDDFKKKQEIFAQGRIKLEADQKECELTRAALEEELAECQTRKADWERRRELLEEANAETLRLQERLKQIETLREQELANCRTAKETYQQAAEDVKASARKLAEEGAEQILKGAREHDAQRVAAAAKRDADFEENRARLLSELQAKIDKYNGLIAEAEKAKKAQEE